MARKKQKYNSFLNDKEIKGTFKLINPVLPRDFGLYAPVYDNPDLALEGMRLYNSQFFDKYITQIMNSEGNVVKTLKNQVVLIYMGVNAEKEIVDTTCCLLMLKPFQIMRYIGEQRTELNDKFTVAFGPIADKITDFRINKKDANKSPCLTLLFYIEDKVTGRFCEFRQHYTAKGGSQLRIPGYPKGEFEGISLSLDVLGTPIKIPNVM